MTRTMARVLIGTSGGITIPGAGRSSPKGCRSSTSCNITPASLRPPNSTACSTGRRRRKRSGAGAIRPAMISSLPGRHRNSSPTGSGCPAIRVNSLELLEDRLSLLGDKAGPILFQLPPNFQADADRLAAFLKLLSRQAPLQFRIPASSWYAPRILSCCPTRISRSACRIIMTRRRRGGVPPISSMCAAMAQAAVTRGTTRSDVLGMGQTHQVMEEAGLRCLCLFRQRPEERRAGRCAQAAAFVRAQSGGFSSEEASH